MDNLRERKNLVMMAGAIGTRKTAFTQKLMVSVPEKIRIIRLDQPPDTGDEASLFLHRKCKSAMIPQGFCFKGYFLKLHDESNCCLVIMDEVHKISDTALEGVRLLINWN